MLVYAITNKIVPNVELNLLQKKKIEFAWPLNSESVPVKKECDCGKPHSNIDKCRYFGTYQCYKCKNRWKSGWTWYGEYQRCRRCGKKNAPIKIVKLRTECEMCGKLKKYCKCPCIVCEELPQDCECALRAPHHVDKCTMCQKLGRKCFNGETIVSLTRRT